MPKPDVSLSAVVVSGGKQYRVGLGDRILVDRLAAEPGSSVKLGPVLLFTDGGEVKVGKDAGALDVDAKVIAHERGRRIESIRYKSKKRVRVHHGGRAHLTALEIIAVGGVGRQTKEEAEAEEAPKPKRGRAKAEPKPKKAAVAVAASREEAETPKKPTRRRTKKESE
ncbi:MAG TPA: 50S ribosomal protein L21 [Candidatus Dormibacteraeota bacterium]|nr:50S ribosomal protein L21 [Candidatus Dormibacteraeota bacterium]